MIDLRQQGQRLLGHIELLRRKLPSVPVNVPFSVPFNVPVNAPFNIPRIRMRPTRLVLYIVGCLSFIFWLSFGLGVGIRVILVFLSTLIQCTGQLKSQLKRPQRPELEPSTRFQFFRKFLSYPHICVAEERSAMPHNYFIDDPRIPTLHAVETETRNPKGSYR